MDIRKLFNTILIISGFIFLSSCSTFNASLDSLLISPKTNNVSIKGTWIVENFYYMYNTNNSGKPDIPIDTYLFLNDNSLNITNNIINFTNYKVKTVKLSDYMRVKFKISDISFLNLKDKEISVFSVEDSNKNLYEFLKYDDNTMFFYYYKDDRMYLLNKISNDINKELLELEKENSESNKTDDFIYNIDDLGFLISFRTDREVMDSSIPRNSYRTIWFYQQNDGTYSSKVMDEIIIPKDDKMLRISVGLSNDNNLYEKILVEEFDLNNGNYIEKINIKATNEDFINQFIDITYINENYIGINYDQNTEYLGYMDNDKIAMLSIDNPFIESRLSFSQVFPNKKDEFYESHQEFVEFINIEHLNRYDQDIKDENFKLSRHAGAWFLKGRIDSKMGNSNEPMDFDIKILPNETLVEHNELSYNLAKIKERVPETIDAFTSPNRDVLVVITENSMYFYKLISNKMSHNTIGEFSLDSKEEIISSQWYIGDEAKYMNDLLNK